MKNFSFVLWMLGWPLIFDFSAFVNQYLLGKKHSDDVKTPSVIFFVVVWVFIAVILYQR